MISSRTAITQDRSLEGLGCVFLQDYAPDSLQELSEMRYKTWLPELRWQRTQLTKLSALVATKQSLKVLVPFL